MKKYRLIVTASLIASLAASTAAFAKNDTLKKPEPPRQEGMKLRESPKHEPAKAPVPAKSEVRAQAPAAPVKPLPPSSGPAVSKKPAPAPSPRKKAPEPPKKSAHGSSKENAIIAIAAALLRLSS